MKFGIDISTFQGNLNLDVAKEEGVKFVIVRGGFTGVNKKYAVDDKFLDFYKKAKEINMPIGIYYFSRATSYEEGENEAKFLYENCLKNRIFEYPIFIDVEDPIYQKDSSKNDITNAIKGFCNYIESKNGYASIYCNLDWANNHMDYTALKDKYDFWLADWSKDKPDTNKYKYGIWQFGGSENYIRSNKIDNKICDQDYAFKDYPKIMSSKNLNVFTTNLDNDESNSKENIEKDIENELEEEVKEELYENKNKIFNLILNFFKKLIGIIFLKTKK